MYIVSSANKNKANICSANKQIYNTVSIKVVDLNHKTNLKTKPVVMGKGLVTSVAGISQQSSNSKRRKHVLSIVLDSGLDGDLLFVH